MSRTFDFLHNLRRQWAEPAHASHVLGLRAFGLCKHKKWLVSSKLDQSFFRIRRATSSSLCSESVSDIRIRIIYFIGNATSFSLRFESVWDIRIRIIYFIRNATSSSLRVGLGHSNSNNLLRSQCDLLFASLRVGHVRSHYINKKKRLHASKLA